MTGIISRLFCLFLKVSGTGSFPPPLSHAEERECFIKARGGDREAREALIEHNLRLGRPHREKVLPDLPQSGRSCLDRHGGADKGDRFL